MHFRYLAVILWAIGSISPLYAESAKNSFSIHYLWQIHGADELNTTVRVYRRYGIEGDNYRNFFIFACPADVSKHVYTEIIPPKQMLEHLNTLTGGKPGKTDIRVARRRRNFWRKQRH